MGILLRPGPEHLPEYCAALEKGWSPNTTRDVSAEELAAISDDPEGWLALLDDPEAKGGDVTMPDGSTVRRIPGFRSFIWDDGFYGIINLRWQHGTTDLPPYVHGHIGFSVVPWKQRQGYASRALAELLPEARALGLDFVELTADIDNIASRRTIEKCGGQFVRVITAPAGLNEGELALYRISLTSA